tara:strand:- start:2678 stop:3511 length:834 start_codon:yes stop_codon:yes gene_type:complete
VKLIFENWRKFIIKEDIGYFGKKFVQFKEMVDAGHHPLKVAKLYLEYIGKGSTRMVFGFKDNKSHLLKVINVELIGNEEAYAADFRNPLTGFDRKHKTVSNENEADLIMQQRYPNIFPRTYEYAPDYSWILTERVQPIDSQKLSELFNIPVDLIRERREDYKQVIEIALAKMKGHLGLNEGSTFQMDPDRERRVDPETLRMQELYTHADAILSDKHNRQIFRAVAELRIPPREISPKNLGISQFGQPHLVILDASLWEYDDAPAQAPVSDTEETFNF